MKTERELSLRYWTDNNLPYDGDDDDMKVAWTAWEASQQGEVDKLQTKIDELNERNSEEKRILHNVIEMNQAKIDDLQKLRSLDEMAINQLAQANQVWRTKCDELQARIDSLTNINESLVAYKNQLLDDIEEKGNEDEN